MTRLRSIAHRLRRGHWREPWSIDWGSARDDTGCSACVRRAVLDDISGERRIGGGGW